MRFCRTASQFAIAISLALVPMSATITSPADAQQNTKLATASYRAGKVKLKTGDYVGALAEFEKAERLHPGFAPKFQIAHCLDKLGRAKEAFAAYRSFLGAKPTDKYKKQIVESGERIAALQATLPVPVKIVVSPPNATGVEIKVDGDVMPSGSIELTPGTHTLEVAAAGHKSFTQQLTVVGGKASQEVAATLEALATTVTRPDNSGADDGPNVVLIAGFATLGVAVVGGVLTGLFGSSALSAESDYNAAPSQTLADDAEGNALLADVFLGVAGAAAVTGVVLVAVGMSDDQEQASGAMPVIVPLASPEVAGATATWRF